MELNISDEKILELAEQEIRKEIRQRVQKVLDNGMGFWFREQTIQQLTHDCIYEMIKGTSVDRALKSIDKEKLTEEIAKSVAYSVSEFLSK